MGLFNTKIFCFVVFEFFVLKLVIYSYKKRLSILYKDDRKSSIFKKMNLFYLF